MTDLVLTDRELDKLKADAVVIGTATRDDDLEVLPGAPSLETTDIREALVAAGASGATGEVVKIPTFGTIGVPVIIAVGLGEAADDYSDDQLRKAAGVAARATKGMKHVVVALAGVHGDDGVNQIRPVGEGVSLGAYRFDEYKSEAPKADDLPAKKVSILVGSARSAAAKKALARAVKVGEAVAIARDFVNTPPNDLYPDSFAQRAKAFAQQAGIKVEILDERRLTTGKYGGILAVGAGSDRKPRLLRLRWEPTGVRRGTPTVALVGKGITFDSGGISLKPGPKMDLMKTDMSGAAAVIAATLLIAALELPIKVTATVPLAENLPSGSAYRPADVITHRGGKRSEILNTDAEGRVVLADAIARACEDNPAYLIETSTLTGAQVVALGDRTAGVMGSDEFRDRVVDAANEVGEAAWGMPLPQDVRDGMRSNVADIANIGAGPGGMLAGGHYLAEFVTEDVQWAHIDIAGPSYNSGEAYGYVAKGGTGVPVRTILQVIEDIVDRG